MQKTGMFKGIFTGARRRSVATTVGSYFKELRTSKGWTLRQFCGENGYDPGNIARLERGIFPAPESPQKLREYAEALGLKEGGEEWFYV